jgi:hypothetical protein
MSRRWTIALILIALPVVAYAGLWLIASSQRGPLSGATTHDFGVVRLTSLDLELKHKYQLTNRIDMPVTIRAAKPECGCVKTERTAITIAPGATGEVPITVHPPIGPKSVLIHLDLGEHGTQTLKMMVEGQPDSRLSVNNPTGALQTGQSIAIPIQADIYESDDEPGAPTVTSVRPITFSFSGWKLKFRPSNFKTAPVQWEGVLSIEQTAESQAEGTLTVTVPGLAPVVVTTGLSPDTQPETAPATAPADR